MKRMHIVILCSIAFMPVCVWASINCPVMPDSVTTVNRDVQSEIVASVGYLGKVKAGEVAVKTEIVAKSLFEKYPNVDRLLTIQMMSATYCSILNSSNISDFEKIQRWETFQGKVLGFSSQSIAKQPVVKRPKLEILEMVSEGDSRLDFTLRNSGNLAAYVNGIQLVFGPMHCGSNVCMVGLGVVRYEFDVKISNNQTEVSHHAEMKIESSEKSGTKKTNRNKDEVQQFQNPKYFEVLSQERAAAELRNESTSMTARVYTGITSPSQFYSRRGFEIQHLMVKKSPILRTSLTIGPNEIQRVRLDLTFLDKDYFLSSCINSCSTTAYGLVFYDSNQVIRTSDVSFYFTNLK